MKISAPIVTLIAGGALAGGLLVANGLTAGGTTQGTSVQVAGSTTGDADDDKADDKAKANGDETAGKDDGEGTADADQAADFGQKERITYAGRVKGGGPLLAISIRNGVAIAYLCDGKLEAWLVNAHIGPYSHGNIWNHEALRRRKLLLHSHQIARFFEGITQKGLSGIPLRMYFKKGRAKIEIGLGKGKKKYDKRETLKRRETERETRAAVKERQR